MLNPHQHVYQATLAPFQGSSIATHTLGASGNDGLAYATGDATKGDGIMLWLMGPTGLRWVLDHPEDLQIVNSQCGLVSDAWCPY